MADKFHVGQDVICVNDQIINTNVPRFSEAGHDRLSGLKKGQKYKIRWEGVCNGEYAVKLQEIQADVRLGVVGGKVVLDCPFKAIRFKPLEEEKKTTDISDFLKLLNPDQETIVKFQNEKEDELEKEEE